jgi:hypothetical protein
MSQEEYWENQMVQALIQFENDPLHQKLNQIENLDLIVLDVNEIERVLQEAEKLFQDNFLNQTEQENCIANQENNCIKIKGAYTKKIKNCCHSSKTKRRRVN